MVEIRTYKMCNLICVTVILLFRGGFQMSNRKLEGYRSFTISYYDVNEWRMNENEFI